MSKPHSRDRVAIRLSVSNLILNFLLSFAKVFSGIFARSSVMISDGLHSLTDCLSTLLIIAGLHSAAKEADSEHQYGHERFESVAAILLSAVLLFTAGAIGWAGITQILHSDIDAITVPGALALWAAVFSILVKEGMYWRTRFYAKKLNSSALMADAWHNRSDALSSIGSFVAIFGARLGFPILDPLASVIIAAFILKAAIDIFRDAISRMTDRALAQETTEAIEALILSHEGVLALDLLQSRKFGDRAYIDIELAIARETPLHLAHAIGQKVHFAILEAFPEVKHCMVHNNPFPRDEDMHILNEKGEEKMQFLVLAYDGHDEGALARRMGARDAHLVMMDELFEKGRLVHAAAIVNEADEMVGSSLIVRYPDEESLRLEWLSREPYVVDEVWKEVRVSPLRVSKYFA